MQNPTRGDFKDLVLGQVGKDIITDTAAHAGTYVELFALTACVIAALVDTTIKSGAMTGLTLGAGQSYYGNITSVTLTSGTMIAYWQ